MKKIYLFGRVVRISFLISFVFLIYVFIDIYIDSNFKLTNLFLLIIVVGIVIYGLVWIYSIGLFIDYKNNKIKINTGISKSNKVERLLSNIEGIDLELDGDLGMNFIIYHKDKYTEKIFYKFYRMTLLEKSQYKRLKKQIIKIKNIN